VLTSSEPSLRFSCSASLNLRPKQRSPQCSRCPWSWTLELPLLNGCQPHSSPTLHRSLLPKHQCFAGRVCSSSSSSSRERKEPCVCISSSSLCKRSSRKSMETSQRYFLRVVRRCTSPLPLPLPQPMPRPSHHSFNRGRASLPQACHKISSSSSSKHSSKVKCRGTQKV